MDAGWERLRAPEFWRWLFEGEVGLDDEQEFDLSLLCGSAHGQRAQVHEGTSVTLLDLETGAEQEQADGIAGVRRAVDELGHVTKQNDSAAHETARGTSELSSRSEELAQLVAQFTLTGTRAGRQSVEPPTAEPAGPEAQPVVTELPPGPLRARA